MIRRINLIGGPGVGKSTTSADVFAYLKKQGESIELVREYVKEWAYEGRQINPYDQMYFFGKQMRKEIVVLDSNVQRIITDSPLILQIVYANKTLDQETIRAMITILKKYDEVYPCVNIILERGDKPYVRSGRFQDYEEAKAIDEYTEIFLGLHEFPVVKLQYDDPCIKAKIQHLMKG